MFKMSFSYICLFFHVSTSIFSCLYVYFFIPLRCLPPYLYVVSPIPLRCVPPIPLYCVPPYLYVVYPPIRLCRLFFPIHLSRLFFPLRLSRLFFPIPLKYLKHFVYINKLSLFLIGIPPSYWKVKKE